MHLLHKFAKNSRLLCTNVRNFSEYVGANKNLPCAVANSSLNFLILTPLSQCAAFENSFKEKLYFGFAKLKFFWLLFFMLYIRQ